MNEIPGIFDGIFQLANVSAWIAIAYFFFRGKIISTDTFNMFIEATKDATYKQAQEIADKIESAVESGVLKAYQKLDEKTGSGD